MATFYLGQEQSWEDYLKALNFLKELRSEIRRSSRSQRFAITRQTQEIIASREALIRKFGEGFDAMNGTLERGFGRLEKAIAETKGSIEDLKASFDYNMALIVDQLALQNETSLRILNKLEAIHNVLQNPLLTQARELFRIGCERLIKGLLDKALEAFLQSAEKDETNFMTQLLIGKLYLYGVNDECNVIDLVKAERHLLAAARYARAESKDIPEAERYAGEAFLHAAISLYAQANMQLKNGNQAAARQSIRRAYELAAESTKAAPRLSVGYYHRAKFAALLGDGKHANQSLEKAIELDENYALKVDADPDFYQIRDDVDDLFIQLRDRSRNKLLARMQRCQNFLARWHFPSMEAKNSKREMQKLLDEAKRCLERNTYFDHQQGLDLVYQAEQIFYALLVHRSGLHTLSAHSGRVTAVGFSPDQSLLVSGGGDNTVHVWKLPENQHLFSLQGHEEAITQMVFSGDGRAVASVDRRGNVKVWNMEDGSIIFDFAAEFGPVHCIAFSPDDRFLAAGCFDRVAVLWSMDDGTLVHELRGHKSSIDTLVFSPDGKLLATGSPDNTAALWEVDTGNLLHTFYGCSGLANSIAFDAGGEVLISGSNDGSVQLYDVSDGTLLSSFPEREGAISWVALSPDRRRLATINFGKALQLWDLKTGRLIYNLMPFSPGIASAQFSPDGTILAASDYHDQSVKLWHTFNGKLMHVIAGNLTCIGFSPDGSILVTGDESGSLKFWSRMVKPKTSGGATLRKLEPSRDWKKSIQLLRRPSRPANVRPSPAAPEAEGIGNAAKEPALAKMKQPGDGQNGGSPELAGTAAEKRPASARKAEPARTAPNQTKRVTPEAAAFAAGARGIDQPKTDRSAAAMFQEQEERQKLIEERVKNGQCYVCGRKLGVLSRLAGIKLCHKHYFHF